MPDFDIGGGQKLVEMEDINDEDLLQWLFKDELQNIEVVELNVASLNPQPEAPKVSQLPLAPKPADVGDQLQPLISEPPKEKKRFKTVTNEELKDLQDSRQAKSTKRNTKWGVKSFSRYLKFYCTIQKINSTFQNFDFYFM